ncbi:hypothetical protein [Streptacidiphilus sp. MAP12-16]|uniref:hypothetical protein n=1 Tax=Streptacidiphilus sp. MAP12-16 TaxID=3156300 RepID=UPI003510D8B0
MTAQTRASARPESPALLPARGRRPSPPDPRASRFLGWLRRAAPALLLFLVARVAGLAVTVALSRGSATHTLRRLAVHWDAAWYLDIARHGYDHAIRPVQPGQHLHFTNLAFFPVYPALIRLVHTVLAFVPWGAAGLLTAGLCSLVAAGGIFAVAAHRYGPRVGTIATLLWGIAPTAAVESAGYSEAAFTALAAWALYALATRRWLTAGALSILAGLTRPTGVAVAAAVVAAAALEVWSTVRESGSGPAWLERLSRSEECAETALPLGRTRLWRPAVAAVLAPMGWLGFVAWTGLRLHRWDAYFRIQALWRTRFDFGHTTAADFKMLFTRDTPVNLYFPMVGCMLIAAAVLLVITFAQRQPLSWLVFSLVIIVITLGDAAYFSSRGRFLLPAFPLLLPIATALVRLRNRITLIAVLASGTGLSALYGAYLMLYSPSPP